MSRRKSATPKERGIPNPTEAQIVAGARAIAEWLPFYSGHPNTRAAAVACWHEMSAAKRLRGKR